MLSNLFIHYKQRYTFFNDFIHSFYNFCMITDYMSLFSQILSFFIHYKQRLTFC